MDRRRFLQTGASLTGVSMLGLPSEVRAASPIEDDRAYWIELLTKTAHPVLTALKERKLKQLMPVEAPHGNVEERRQYTYLEAMGRLLAGIAPWLETGSTAGDEGALRAKYAELAREAIAAGTDPVSPDFMNFEFGGQPLVDAAFLALAIVRAPNELWKKLDAKTQANTITALKKTRRILPAHNNWLLFPAMVEAALLRVGGSTADWDAVRIDYALRSMDSWYKGDGVYGDGPEYHCDYYNSYVIHPMLLNILDLGGMAVPAWSKAMPYWSSMVPEMTRRAQRYAAIQERLIGPDGAFPPIGRSLCYRFGAFHLLAEIALRRQLPEHVLPEQVRAGLTAVMRRMMEAPGTFDENGWLRVGFCGHQPEMAETYISTGSCYLCSAAWLPLGLPATDPFWAASAKPWTSKKVWSGENVGADHAISDVSRSSSG